MTRKTYVVDTSAIVYDPECWKKFQDTDIVIPIIVLEELDKVKSNHNESGFKARMGVRALFRLSEEADLGVKISLDNGNTIRIDTGSYTAIGESADYGDNKILGCALALNKKNKNIFIISRDFALIVRARILGLKAELYEKNKTDSDHIYQGHRTVINEECGILLAESGIVVCRNYEELSDLSPNEYVLFLDEKGKGLSVGRKVGGQILLVKEQFPWGLKSKNFEQLCLIDAAMNPNIPLVSCSGISGGGKTLSVLASALQLVLNDHKYGSLVIYKSVQGIEGEEIGFLPGELGDKIAPVMSSLSDSFAFLFSDKSKTKDTWKVKLHQYITNNTISFEAINFARGRSFSDTLIILEEGQNINQHTMKLLLTRIGSNSKIIITGDTQQVDSSRLDSKSNALAVVMNKFRDSELAAHINVSSGIRSPLATLSSEIL
jgi:PhoH-like ATPase